MKPSEHKTVQARILKYADEIGWTVVSREEAEVRRGFDPEAAPRDRAKGTSLVVPASFSSKPKNRRSTSKMIPIRHSSYDV